MSHEPRMNIRCPHCQKSLNVKPSMAGKTATCPNCDGNFQIQVPLAEPDLPDIVVSGPRESMVSRSGYPMTELHGGIPICWLISGIGNCIAAIFWLSLYFTFFLAIPLIVLAVFEFIAYGQSETDSNQQVRKKLENAKVLGIIEIICGLVSTAALVCGICNIVFRSKQIKAMRLTGKTDKSKGVKIQIPPPLR